MLTIFAAPKPFRGQADLIQTNALKSWVALSRDCEIVLFGDEEGIAERAAQYGVRHIAKVQRSQFGPPFLNDLFSQAARLARHRVVCYVNADIILLPDFIAAVERAQQSRRLFLLAGRRWDVHIPEPLDCQEPHWEIKLRERVRRHSRQRPPGWIDYFAFPKDLFDTIPPFIIGRPYFDNWLLWKAQERGAVLIDASPVVTAVHQYHDYGHHPQGKAGVRKGAEAQRNQQLLGGWRHCFLLTDATYRMTPTGVRRNFSWSFLARKLVYLKRLIGDGLDKLWSILFGRAQAS